MEAKLCLALYVQTFKIIFQSFRKNLIKLLEVTNDTYYKDAKSQCTFQHYITCQIKYK
jgi:hypothetical protein